MERNEVAVPVNSAHVLSVLEWPTKQGGSIVLQVKGAVLVAYASERYTEFEEGRETPVRLLVHSSPYIDTSPVKRPHSFMQMYRMAWRTKEEPRMVCDGWNMTVPDIVAWGDVEGLSEFGGIVSVNGVRFEVELEEPIRREFTRARRYAFRGGLHVVPASD